MSGSRGRGPGGTAGSVRQLPTRPVTVRVPAKINLELAVGPLRADGYHPLATIYQAVGLYDEVTAEPAAEWSCAVTGRDADRVPTDETNLALRAGRALAARSGEIRPCRLSIRKAIPVAGGMAGGSADAAAALLACATVWGLDVGREILEEVAAGLGSDVPFLLRGGTAVGSGRGEVVTPVLARGAYHWVFVPGEGSGLSTPQVYRAFDERTAGAPVPPPQPSPDLMVALRGGEPAEVAPLLSNDLQPDAVALQPRVGEVVAAALEHGALAAIVSGSGPTVAALTAGPEAAIDLAVALTASGAADEVLRAVGPVPGAQVVTGPGR